MLSQLHQISHYTHTHHHHHHHHHIIVIASHIILQQL